MYKSKKFDGKYFHNVGQQNRFNSHYSNNNNNSSYTNNYDRKNYHKRNYNINVKNVDIVNDEIIPTGRKYHTFNFKRNYKGHYIENQNRIEPRMNRDARFNIKGNDFDINKKRFTPNSEYVVTNKRFSCSSTNSNGNDEDRRVIIPKIIDPDNNFLSSDRLFDDDRYTIRKTFNHQDTSALKSEGNVLNRLSLSKDDPYENERFWEESPKKFAGDIKERWNSLENPYYNDDIENEREFFSDFKERKRSRSNKRDFEYDVNRYSSNTINDDILQEELLGTTLYQKYKKDSFSGARKAQESVEEFCDNRYFEEEIVEHSSKRDISGNRLPDQTNGILELFDRNIVGNDTLSLSSKRDGGLSNSEKGFYSNRSSYDLEEQEMLRKYIMNKLLQPSSSENEELDKDSLEIFMENMGVTSDELKRYLDQELERRNDDMDILQTTLKNLYRDKRDQILADFFKGKTNQIECSNHREANDFKDEHHLTIKNDKYSPIRRSFSPRLRPHDVHSRRDFNNPALPSNNLDENVNCLRDRPQNPIHRSRFNEHSKCLRRRSPSPADYRSSRGRSRSLGKEFPENNFHTTKVYKDESKRRNRSISPRKPSHDDNLKERDIETPRKCSSIELRHKREYSPQDRRHTEHSDRHDVHSRSTSSVRYKSHYSTKDEHVNCSSGSPKRKRRFSCERNSGHSNRIRNSEHIESPGSESPIKFDSSIEKMLIRAGEQSVEQFKEEQVTNFILKKFQLVQSLNYLPVMGPKSFPLLVNKLPNGGTPLIFPSQQNSLMMSQKNENENATRTQTHGGSDSPLVTSPKIWAITSTATASKNITQINLDKTVNEYKSSTEDHEQIETARMKEKNESETRDDDCTNVEETLSMLKKESSKSVSNRTGNKTFENEKSEYENQEKGHYSSNDELTITKVVDSKKRDDAIESTTYKSVVSTTAYQRKVSVKPHGEKNSFDPITSELSANIPKSKVRVPSWFNSRCIELLKKRHKKMQQLKKAKSDPNATCEQLGSLKESLRGINREYIPLVKKSKSEYKETKERNNNKSKNDEIRT